MGDADYIHAFQKVIMPIAMEFAPELVISTLLILNYARDK
jgi:acetoin utilization deacetylase AcuC-like enzyme